MSYKWSPWIGHVASALSSPRGPKSMTKAVVTIGRPIIVEGMCCAAFKYYKFRSAVAAGATATASIGNWYWFQGTQMSNVAYIILGVQYKHCIQYTL